MTCLSPNVAYWFKPGMLCYKGYRGFDTPVFRGAFRGWDVDYTPSYVPLDVLVKMQLYLMPCGKCKGCRLDNMKQWFFRGVSELAEHEVSCFLTLTVNDDMMSSVFPNSCLCHRPFQLFMKKLRKKFPDVRYLMCGEYGTNSLRPHYHAVLFGFFPDDVNLLSFNGDYEIYTSSFLDSLWRECAYKPSYGFHSLAFASPETIRYLTGYVVKKADFDYGDKPKPYIRASNRPAIGLRWFNRYKNELFAHGSDLSFPNSYVCYDSLKQTLPRYFLKRWRLEADNVDYVGFLDYRLAESAKRPLLDLCDLKRKADYLECVTNASHNKFLNEV